MCNIYIVINMITLAFSLAYDGNEKHTMNDDIQDI